MFLLIIGLVGLWFGTKAIIYGANGIAARFDLSPTFVGVAILAVGTDLPEVFVSIKASLLHLQGVETSGIITGNAIGSSISQLTFILGISGLFLSFTIAKKILLRDGIALLTSLLLLFLFGIDHFISRMEGAILLLVYVVYYVVLLKNKRDERDKVSSDGKVYSNIVLGLALLLGFSLLLYSSHLVVQHSMLLAEQWGVAQSFVGIVIIGLGTSLPELAVSVGAALKKSAGLSVGNVIGSSIFDGFIPIGLGGVISTTTMEGGLLGFDLPFLLAATLVVLLFLRNKRGISRLEGMALIGIYLLYIGIKLFYFEGISLF